MTPTPLASVPTVAAADARQAAAWLAADRWSLWRTLTRGLAHHLANAAQMLALDPPPARACAEASERVATAGARLSEVHAATESAPTLLPPVLEDLQALQRLQAGFRSTELVLDVAPDLPAVTMPAAELRHVLLALVTNAKQAAGNERATIRVTVSGGTDGAECVVEDGGPGLPPALAATAFEPYVTTRTDDALGLGLTVARELARRAGGDLVVEPGTSRFRLALPAWRRTHPAR